MTKTEVSEVDSSEREDENPTKRPKTEKRAVYSLMMQEPGYRNGGTKIMFQLFKTLEGAKAAKTNWVQGWGDDHYDFDSDDAVEEGDDKEEGDEDDKLPKYDHDSLIFDGDCGGDYIYCEIEEIDLDAPDRADGSFFFTSMNA